MSIHEVKGHGFILRLIQAQEADVIIRIISSNGEKISGFAKAGLKSRKRFGGALEPLTHIGFRAIKKPDKDLFFLEETEVRHEFQNLRKDFDRLTAATYIAELTELGIHEGLENPEVYNLIGAAFRGLDSGFPADKLTRQFEVKLLSLLGWLPGFQICASCGKSQEDFTLQAETGLVTCQDCGISPVLVSVPSQEMMSQLLQTSILKNENLKLDSDLIQRITSSLFQAHLGSQKLKSTQFLNSLRRFQK
jgi:DNA repair protein RecO (recombination protein O)